MSNDLQLTRDVLAKFLPNHQAIKVFEQLTQMVGTDLPDSIVVLTLLLEELSVTAGITDSKADQALATLESIAASLDVLAKAPVPATQDDLQPLRLAIGDLQVLPRAELGTMAAQQAANVAITGGTLSGVTISGTGFVVGPASAVNNNVALFDGVTGSLIKDGGTLGTAAYTPATDYVAVASLASGIATWFTTPSSANLRSAMTDETGTGALVFATSPSLVTPLLGTPTSGVLTNCTGLPVGSGISGLGANVATFLATPSSANLASAVTDETGTGALVFANTPTLVTPVLGTPGSGTLTNCTGLPIATGVSGLGANVATFLATPSSANLAAAVTGETGTGALVFADTPTLIAPLLGTPTSGNLSNCTALPVGSISGLGANVSTFLATPSSANLAAAVTDETGTGALVFANTPTLVTPVLGTPGSGTLTNCTGLPVATGISGLGANVATFLATPSSANLAAAVTGETGSGALVFATSPTLVTPVLGVAAATSINFGGTALSVYAEGAWSATPAPAGGSFTTISFVGTYTRVGRRVMCNAVFHITNKGTAAGTLLIALPFTPVASSPIFGWEDNVVAKAVSGSSTGSDMELRMVDGTTIYTNGANYVLFCSFDI